MNVFLVIIQNRQSINNMQTITQLLFVKPTLYREFDEKYLKNDKKTG